MDSVLWTNLLMLREVVRGWGARAPVLDVV